MASAGQAESEPANAREARCIHNWLDDGSVDAYDQHAQRMTGTGQAACSSAVSADSVTTEPQLYYIHTDHLGTPQELTDRDGNLQW